jgi:L-asparaginase II
LVEVTRGGRLESLHLGAVAVVDGRGELVESFGSPALSAFLRSTAKPFQLLPLLLSGGADRLGLVEPELAVLTSSHVGAPEHLAAVRSVLAKLGLDESALGCGAHEPLDTQTQRALRRAGALPSPIHNNCSGNHAAMLAQAVERGLSLTDYLAPEHPVQRTILQTLADMTGLDPDAITVGVDNCSAPCFAMPLRACALAFARLARPDEPASPCTRLLDAMAKHPELVAGEGRFDTDLMRATRGRIVSKAGAEGYLGMVVRDRGWGVAIKIIDGNGTRALGPAAVGLLQRLGLLTDEELEALSHHRAHTLKSHLGAVVGAVRPAGG